MCGRKRSNDFADVPESGRDMVRMRGTALRLMHEADRDEEIEQLEEQLEEARDAHDEAFRFNCLDDIDHWSNRIESIEDEIAGLESGAYRPAVPPYDPADERAVKVGHENPIAWVRRTEREVREIKRKRRIEWRNGQA